MPPKTKTAPKNVTKGLTPAEVSWLTELPTKTINASIDKGELGDLPKRAGRRLGPAEVVYFMVRQVVSPALTRKGKLELYEQLVKSEIGESWRWLEGKLDRGGDLEIAIARGVITVQLKSVRERLAKRYKALENASQIVVSDPDIRGGEPIVAGTRIPVYLVADLLKQGADVKEILEDYPALNATKIRAALAYALTHPRRGRPRTAPWKKAG
jgi:uncharacterized protein (DUF433 family)